MFGKHKEEGVEVLEISASSGQALVGLALI